MFVRSQKNAWILSCEASKDLVHRYGCLTRYSHTVLIKGGLVSYQKYKLSDFLV